MCASLEAACTAAGYPHPGGAPRAGRDPKSSPRSIPRELIPEQGWNEKGQAWRRPGASRHTPAGWDNEPTVCASQGRIPASQQSQRWQRGSLEKTRTLPTPNETVPSKTSFVLHGNNPGSTQKGMVPAPRRCSAPGIPGMALTQPYKPFCSCSSCLTGSTGSTPRCNPCECDAPSSCKCFKWGGKACGKCAISRPLCPGTHFPLLPIFLPCSTENLLLYCEFSAPLGSLVSFTHKSRGGGGGNKNSCFRPLPFLQSCLECFFHGNTVRAKIKQEKKKNREVLRVSEQVLEALESSGSKQQWGI